MADDGNVGKFLKFVSPVPFCWFTRVAMGKSVGKQQMAPTGTPDVIGVVLGMPMALEFKTATGKVRDVQLECHERMRRAGWKVFVVRSLPEAVEKVRVVMNHKGWALSEVTTPTQDPSTQTNKKDELSVPPRGRVRKLRKCGPGVSK